VRTFQRWAERYEEDGADGLKDGRLNRPSPKRAPREELERMLRLFRDKYSDFTMKHFHEKLVKRHSYYLGYTVTKLTLHARRSHQDHVREDFRNPCRDFGQLLCHGGVSATFQRCQASATAMPNSIGCASARTELRSSHRCGGDWSPASGEGRDSPFQAVQSPAPDRPQFKLGFTIAPGPAVLPLPPPQQAQAQVHRLPPQGELVATPAFSGVDQPVVVRGSGFAPGKVVALKWTTVTGNRIGSGEQVSSVQSRMTSGSGDRPAGAGGSLARGR
jgi:hypothetical protein